MKLFLKNFSTRYTLALFIVVALVLPNAAQAFVTTLDMPLSATNMVPNSSASGSFAVENTTGFTQKVGIQVASTTGDFALFADHMTFSITGDFSGSGDLGDLVNVFDLSSVPDGETHNYTFTLTLNSDAPQYPLMGKAFGFDLIVGLEEGTTVVVPVLSSGGGGGGGRSSRLNRSDAPTPQILGASSEKCEQLLVGYIYPNRSNDITEVTKLQTFLRDLEGHFDLEVNGIYDEATQQAVSEFQQKYSENILKPWGIPIPTRFVYHTTRKMINEIYCDFSRDFPLTADQQAEIAWYRDQGITYRQNNSEQSSKQATSGGGILPGVTSTVNEVIDLSQNIATSIGEQAASAVSSGSGFLGKVWTWFKSIFSR